MTDKKQPIGADESALDLDLGPLQEAVRTVFSEMEDALLQFARTGEIAIDDLARRIALSLASIAIDGVFGSLASILTSEDEYAVSNTLPKLDHGVLAGASGATVPPVGLEGGIPLGLGPCVRVTINAYGSPLGAVRQSEGQIAAAVARAVRRGVMKL